MAWLLASPIEDDKTNHFFQIGEATPFRKLADVIFTDQAINRCVTFASPNLLNGIDGIGRRRAPQFAIIRSKSRFVFNSSLYHHQSYFVSRNGRGLSERRHASGNKNHLVSTKSLKGLTRNDEMTVMNGIKRSAVDCDLFQFSTFTAQHCILNPSSASRGIAAFTSCMESRTLAEGKLTVHGSH